jgi:hypothetical protein
VRTCNRTSASRLRSPETSLRERRLKPSSSDESKVAFLNGFSTKSTTPAFIALTASATSPCPVMMTTGSVTPFCCSISWTVHARHSNVGQDAAVGEIPGGLQEVDAGFIGLDLVAGGLQHETDRAANRRIVVDQMDNALIRAAHSRPPV